jgi:hypothetical protein
LIVATALAALNVVPAQLLFPCWLKRLSPLWQLTEHVY